MISRLTFSAAVFAILATASIGFAAETHQQQRTEATRSVAAGNGIVVLPAVEITGHRIR